MWWVLSKDTNQQRPQPNKPQTDDQMATAQTHAAAGSHALPPTPFKHLFYCKPEVAIAALHFTVSLLHYHVKVDNSFSSFALQGQGPQQSAEEAPIMLLETALWAASAADARATFPLLSWLVEALPPANALLNFTRKAIHRLKSKHSGFSTAYPHAVHPIAHNTENHRNNHYPHLQKYKRLL